MVVNYSLWLLYWLSCFLSHLCGGECGATALSATAYFLSHLCGGE
ncbi:hypothetical protein BAZOLSSOX_1342 [uncultured Gammaproteobacteria bacterium]|nr:hypothetical protein BAZOLSSOX_1342 [uncultured Gammaproteobacteria bacterium]